MSKYKKILLLLATFEEKMALLLDAESDARNSRKLAKRVKEAGFKDEGACVEDVVYIPERSLSKDRIKRFAECAWVQDCETLVIISKSGCGNYVG